MSEPIRHRRSATLKDVAELAGVSTATIARVMHKKGYVSESTRIAVEAALAQSGYRVNAVAQGLRKQRTFMIGHVLKRIAANPFFAEVALGAQEEAFRSDCGVVLANTQADAERERQAVEMLIQRRVDAIIFTTWTDERNVRVAVEAGVPVVQVQRVGDVETHTVTADNYSGALDATAHLLSLGHRRIAFIGVDPYAELSNVDDGPVPVTHRVIERDRLNGFLDAHNVAGVKPFDELIDLQGSYYSVEHARVVVKRLLTLPPHHRPTAVFATSDMIAAGVLQEIYAHGLRIPSEISVVGFDDTLSTLFAPPLTTVEQPMREIGQAAARLAIHSLQEAGGSQPFRHEQLTTTLVLRESTGPVSGIWS